MQGKLLEFSFGSGIYVARFAGLQSAYSLNPQLALLARRISPASLAWIPIFMPVRALDTHSKKSGFKRTGGGLRQSFLATSTAKGGQKPAENLLLELDVIQKGWLTQRKTKPGNIDIAGHSP